MRKVVLQLTVMVCFFFAMWWGLSMLPWRRWFNISELSKKKEKQISEMVLRTYRKGRKEIKGDSVLYTVNLIRDKICLANGIDTGDIHLHVFEDEEVNAFTIPMGHIIIHSALIKECDNPEMLAGVMAHEIAHSELNHITKRLATEIGLATLLSVAGDNSGIIMRIIHTLSSTGFDRKQETEADNTGMRYLEKARIDTRPMAGFLNKLAEKEKNVPESLEWVSTHPNPGKRAKAILAKSRQGNHQAVIDSTGWARLKAVMNK